MAVFHNGQQGLLCRRVTGGIASWIEDGWNGVLFIWKLCSYFDQA